MSSFSVLKVLTLFEGFAVGGHTVEAYLPDFEKKKEGAGEVEKVSVVQRWGDTGGRGEWRRGERVTVSSGSCT